MGFFTEDELSESKDEFEKIDALEKEAEAAAQKPDVDTSQDKKDEQDTQLPEKYRGKSIEDVIRMHQSAEELITKHGEEVGFARKLAAKLADRLESEQGSQHKRSDADPEDSNVDYFANPQKVITDAINNHPDIVKSREITQRTEAERSLQRVTEAVGDPQVYLNDPEFNVWLRANPFRMQALQYAHTNNNADAAIDLFTNFKRDKAVKDSVVEEKKGEINKENKEARQKAIVDTGGSGEKSTGKVYRKADLIRLQNTDPARYERLEGEILRAYAEGRVK